MSASDPGSADQGDRSLDRRQAISRLSERCCSSEFREGKMPNEQLWFIIGIALCFVLIQLSLLLWSKLRWK